MKTENRMLKGTMTMNNEQNIRPFDNPSRPAPDIDQLIEWESEGGCEATDGCWVEPDGTCEHGCQSWLLELGMI